MTITSSHHVLAVHDWGATDAFYRDVLGFERTWGDGNWTFYRLGAAMVMAGLCPDDLPPAQLGSHSYVGYFEVEDVDAFHTRVVERGEGGLAQPAELSKPLRCGAEDDRRL